MIDTLIENEIGLGYSDLYDKAFGRLAFRPSHTDFQEHLVNMLQCGFVSKSGKLYIITKMAKRARKLGVLGVGEDVERRRRLYQFLLLCDRFYKAKRVCEQELDVLLRYAGATRENLVEESHVQVNGTNCCEIVYKPISTIKVRTTELGNDNGKNFRHYYEEDGFSIKEAMDLLIGLRDYPLFVGNFNYSEDEVREYIELLKNEGLLRLTGAYDAEQSRYIMMDDFLQKDNSSEKKKAIKKMRDTIWNIHTLEMNHLDLEGRSHKLSVYEKEGLRSLFGGVGSYKLIKAIYSRKGTLSVSELKSQMDMINAIIDLKIKDFYDEYQDLIRENYLFYDMINKIVIRNSVLKNPGFSSKNVYF